MSIGVENTGICARVPLIRPAASRGVCHCLPACLNHLMLRSWPERLERLWSGVPASCVAAGTARDGGAGHGPLRGFRDVDEVAGLPW